MTWHVDIWHVNGKGWYYRTTGEFELAGGPILSKHLKTKYELEQERHKVIEHIVRSIKPKPAPIETTISEKLCPECGRMKLPGTQCINPFTTQCEIDKINNIIFNHPKIILP